MMRCGVDGCDASIVGTIHPGVFVCLADHGEKQPVFEMKGRQRKISRGTVIAIRAGQEGAEDGHATNRSS